ncbi:hypothetical protein CcrJ4_gp430 [Caulobacter phage J4]|nr:hypothetical protein CcrJ4_gp430 [Caulobacter phage J4]
MRFVAPALARKVLEESRFFTEDAPFTGRLYDGDPRLTLIVGENAAGKSLFFRVMNAHAKLDHGITGITISIRERTDSSVPFRRMFMFGDEAEQSTGATSFKTILSGFNTANGDQQGKTMLMIDEPEMGLSDGYARALGEYLGQQAHKLEDNCHGLVVVTHNRPLAAGLQVGLGAAPTFVCLGSDPVDLASWQTRQEVRTVDDLFALKDLALERWRKTNTLMKEK